MSKFYYRRDDGELFTENKNHTFSLESSKREFPTSTHDELTDAQLYRDGAWDGKITKHRTPQFVPRDPCIWVEATEDNRPPPAGNPVRHTSVRPVYGHGTLEKEFHTDLFCHYDGEIADIDEQPAMVNNQPAWLITRKRRDDKPGRCGLLVFAQDISEAIEYIEQHNKPTGVHF